MKSIALVFPGQGSQFVGMGKALSEAYPVAKWTFQEADEVLGRHLSSLCFDGPADELTDTVNAQPALLAASIATLRVLDDLGVPMPEPLAVAGHSMGEYTALVRAGSLSFHDALSLVQERGRQMKLAGEKNPGGMAAIIALDGDRLAEICAQASEKTRKPVQVANYNSPGQIVISGDREALARAMEMAKTAGARRVIPLAVSIAAHSPLMLPAASAFAKVVEETPFADAHVPVVLNVTARPATSAKEMQRDLVMQLTSSVQWVKSVQWMIEQNVDTFIEVGAGNVLSGLIRRIDRKVKTFSVGDPDSVANLSEWLTGEM